jgi:hypothetical protein
MTELKKCLQADCNPVEQTRGRMKPEDHHLQVIHLKIINDMVTQGVPVRNASEFHRDVHEVEPSHEENQRDFRISCSKCGRATGWGRADIEETRRHADGDYRRHTVVSDGNKDNIRQQWNNLVK